MYSPPTPVTVVVRRIHPCSLQVCHATLLFLAAPVQDVACLDHLDHVVLVLVLLGLDAAFFIPS